MNPPSPDRLAAHFERLVAMPAQARAAELDRLPLDEGERRWLEGMLAADDNASDPVADSIAAGAGRVSATRVERLGPWRLLREIGAGGMGTVFLAERADGGFTQRAAIKLLRGFPTREGMRRLRQERQILAGLDHPNIARLLDGGESSDGQPWFALEYVDGVPLLDHIAASSPSRDRRLALFTSMLDAVEHAHQRLVIHRDLKPANVLVAGGAIKLLDFGIARLVELDPVAGRETSTRVFSRGYASPEQREGRAITTASDVYSLGVLLREMLTGRDDASATWPRLPLDAELEGILGKACADDPRDRYMGAGGFRDDIVRYREGRPVRAAAFTRTYRLRKFLSRHRVASALGTLAVALLGIFVWRLDAERARAVTAEHRTQGALETAERDAARARAALDFLTDAFSAASPEVARSPQVSVRDLLDAARHKLDERQAGHPELHQIMQRLLAHLYGSLGEATIASELMREGLSGVEPGDAAEGLRLADDYEEYASELGVRAEGAAALEAAREAVSLRERFAPADDALRVRSLLAVASAHHRNADNRKAIELLDEASALAERTTSVEAAVRVELSTVHASLLAMEGDCARATEVAQHGLELNTDSRREQTPDHVMLMRAKASARSACGRPAEAAASLREAIALQERLVGRGGARMMTLTNDLALALNDLGEYREAAAMLGVAEVAMRGVGLGAFDEALGLSNQAGTFENAGDYASSMALSDRAVALVRDARLPGDELLLRRVERTRARTMGIVGRHDEARTILEELRDRSERIEGRESGEYAMLLWQLAQLEMRAGKPERVEPLLDNALRAFARIVPESHPLFAHAHRIRANLSRQRSDLTAATREARAAVAAFEASGSLAVDLAIARAELAAILSDTGHVAESRALLEAALPVMRSSLLPTEVNRIAAEEVARRYAMPSAAD